MMMKLTPFKFIAITSFILVAILAVCITLLAHEKSSAFKINEIVLKETYDLINEKSHTRQSSIVFESAQLGQVKVALERDINGIDILKASGAEWEVYEESILGHAELVGLCFDQAQQQIAIVLLGYLHGAGMVNFGYIYLPKSVEDIKHQIENIYEFSPSYDAIFLSDVDEDEKSSIYSLKEKTQGELTELQDCSTEIYYRNQQISQRLAKLVPEEKHDFQVELEPTFFEGNAQKITPHKIEHGVNYIDELIHFIKNENQSLFEIDELTLSKYRLVNIHSRNRNMYQREGWLLFFDSKQWWLLQHLTDSSKGFYGAADFAIQGHNFEFYMCVKRCGSLGRGELVRFSPQAMTIKMMVD